MESFIHICISAENMYVLTYSLKILIAIQSEYHCCSNKPNDLNIYYHDSRLCWSTAIAISNIHIWFAICRNVFSDPGFAASIWSAWVNERTAGGKGHTEARQPNTSTRHVQFVHTSSWSAFCMHLFICKFTLDWNVKIRIFKRWLTRKHTFRGDFIKNNWIKFELDIPIIVFVLL